MEMKLYDMFGIDTLRDRQTALLVIREISEIPNSCTVKIDFTHIIFASRSFCHELLVGLKDRKNISFQNVNTEVKNMMIAALKKPNIPITDPIKVTAIS